MLVVDGREVAALEVAATRRVRGRGLLGRDALDGALWLPGVRSVHTVGMRFAIDVAWLASDGTVRRVTSLAPWRCVTWYVPRPPCTGRRLFGNTIPSPRSSTRAVARVWLRGRCSVRTNSPPV